jgi:hypothetical protein
MKHATRITWVLCAAGLMTWLSGCGDSKQRESLRRLFSDDGLLVIGSAGMVEAYLVDSLAGEQTPPRLSEMPMRSGPVAVPPEIVGDLRATLLDSRMYDWQSSKGCVPRYDARVRFSDPAGTVDVLICFTCEQLAVFREDRLVGIGNSDPMRAILLDAVAKLFPDDAAIQAIKDKPASDVSPPD